jgi:RNA binding exosome subunit
MFDCAQDIQKYHNDEVMLSGEMRKKLRENRNANRDRLKNSLKEKKKPQPLRFQKQGSYAMRTTIQEEDNDYDIDDGVVFGKDSLKGDRGGEMSPLDARQMVCDAMQDKRFNKKPEVLKNCVRVYYNEGHHVDIPVYRESGDESTGLKCELASSEWRESNPAEINEWFDKQVGKKKSEEDDDDSQFRRMIRLLKRYATSRPSWNLPSGLILTILIDEQYTAFDDRDDRCFYNVINAIKNRLEIALTVKNPVQDEILTKDNPDPQVVDLRVKLGDAISTLKVLLDSRCTRSKALKAWADVFNTDYFDDEIEKGETKASFVITGDQPSKPVHKAGGGRFG